MKKVTHRSEQQIKQILSNQITSGLSVKDFCAREHLAQSTFWNWRKRFGKCTAPATSQKPVEFIEIGSLPTDTVPEIEIHVGHATVRLNRGCDSQLVTTVLSTLAQLYDTSHEAAACN